MKSITIYISCLFIGGCAVFSARQIPEGGSTIEQFTSDPTCNSTQLSPVFVGDEPGEAWKNKVLSSAQTVGQVLASDDFAQRCQSLNLIMTRGETVQEVCRRLVCAGDVSPDIGFYYDQHTRAIAYEEDGALYINTAKGSQGAGGVGNIAHEFTHTLGYKHFTNFALLGSYSVPYEVGELVEELKEIAEPAL